MESSSDSPEEERAAKIKVGDQVIFRRDGTRGIVYARDGERLQVLWEDEFVSWEKEEDLSPVETG